jgi:hypothetical protein
MTRCDLTAMKVREAQLELDNIPSQTDDSPRVAHNFRVKSRVQLSLGTYDLDPWEVCIKLLAPRRLSTRVLDALQ